MLLELSVGPFGGPDGELIAQKLEDKTLQLRRMATRGGRGKRHLDAEYGALLGYGLDSILGGDDVKDKASIFGYDALDADSAYTSTPDHLNFSTVQVGSGQLCSSALTASVHLRAQYLAHVAEPQVVQRQEGIVGVGSARDTIQAQNAALFGGERFGLESLVAFFKLALALDTAGLFCGDLGWRRGRA